MSTYLANSSNRPGGSGGKKAEAIDDMLNCLGIEEEEFDDLVFEDEECALKEGIKWMALARVHTSNYFILQTFEQHLRIAWSTARDVDFKHLEGNMFTIQCFCLGDWLKLEKGVPWLFHQSVVYIEPYDGFSPTEAYDLNFFATWIQTLKIPVGYRDETLITNLTEKKAGKVLEVQTDVRVAGNFVRVKVRLDVRKVLTRFISLSRGGQSQVYQIEYEKMSRFCGACGFIGHTHLECGSGEHEANLKWGIG
uniref:Uncharacterized protein n=1 Tax=Avena sativa TaxID=4498 RepID=A0ACD5ZER8_AVESA